jgi:hypothetical protein
LNGGCECKRIVSRNTSRGDHIKVEFADEEAGVGEWIWGRVKECNDRARIVIGRLDSAPVNDASGKLKVGTELAISYSQIRELRKRSSDH